VFFTANPSNSRNITNPAAVLIIEKSLAIVHILLPLPAARKRSRAQTKKSGIIFR
jgi:hypothetical protein